MYKQQNMYKCFQTCLKFQPVMLIGPLVLDALLNIPDGEIARRVDEVFRCRDYRSTCPMCLWFGFTRCRYPDCSAQRERERETRFICSFWVCRCHSFRFLRILRLNRGFSQHPALSLRLVFWIYGARGPQLSALRCVMGSMLWLVQNVSSGQQAAAER